MRFTKLQGMAAVLAIAVAIGFLFTVHAYSQETTGGLQGTVKDPAGAVVPKASVVVTGTTLIGSKELVTDTTGYYRFANLPPGSYTLVVKAEGFSTYKREGLEIGIGRLPTVDVALKVGSTSMTVQVTEEAPVIDTTSTQNIVNITPEAIQNLPTGTSFQSVIQFAPMARNEPLGGQITNGRAAGGSGGSLPGSSGGGNAFGYSIGGAADSESSYLVEGQDTQNISSGYSKANVPMEFVQEVEMKTSGVAAEFGGALGGVVNVVMKKGSQATHGMVFSNFNTDFLDGNARTAYLRYDPLDGGTATVDPGWQLYQGQKDPYSRIQPGVEVGGPIIKDRLVYFVGFAPVFYRRSTTVDFGGTTGKQYFENDQQTYYATARVDATITPKIRVYATWLNQYARGMGVNVPISDPIATESTYYNTAIGSPVSRYSHLLGFATPNLTFNTGADISITQNLVSTTRYGYFFDNYHDFGWQTSTPDLAWATSGINKLDNTGTPNSYVPATLQYASGHATAPYTSSFTKLNADKHYQLNQDFAYYKNLGHWGTHNFKFGYQLNHLLNVINQNGNVPWAEIVIGPYSYTPYTGEGAKTCALLAATWGGCYGQYGYLLAEDFATVLTDPASDWNHAFYAQDAWTASHGVTVTAGLRIEKETLPAPGGVDVKSIAFNWSDKIEPRLGVAWDPKQNGKMKAFASFGVVNDVMKLLVAQTSWGGQGYNDCVYPLGPNSKGTFDVADIDLIFKSGRACPSGDTTTGANFASGSTPASLTDSASGVSLIENMNWRPYEPVAPGTKPYRQHEWVGGFDYQIKKGWSAEVRYDRRRLDHVIEDAALSDTIWGELYAIVNPGEGVNSTLDGYASYLKNLGHAFGPGPISFNSDPTSPFGTCADCPVLPKAIRNYDGVEARLTMTPNSSWYAMISYTYSRLWGNYTGLTSTDQSEGTTGRASPDTTRAFDEPYFYYGANGKSNNGLLPTDRPNVLKGYAYYSHPWNKRQSTDIGIFQDLMQGSPMASYISVGSGRSVNLYPFGRGQWVDITSSTFDNIQLGTPYTRRTPWYTQSDLNLVHRVQFTEGQSFEIEVTAQNALNQRAATAFYSGMGSDYSQTGIYPGNLGITDGAAFYDAAMHGYNTQSLMNSDDVITDSRYGQPMYFQAARTTRISVKYTF